MLKRDTICDAFKSLQSGLKTFKDSQKYQMLFKVRDILDFLKEKFFLIVEYLQGVLQ